MDAHDEHDDTVPAARTETWRGVVDVRVTARLRDRLFALLGSPGTTGVRLDVRAVTSIDASGMAVLVGARRKAQAVGRTLVLVDEEGPVTVSLRRTRLLPAFLVTQAAGADHV
jgi:anti-anti-sigma factor